MLPMLLTVALFLPPKKSGHKIVGIDSHEGMLNEAKKKSSKLKLPIEWIQQDCTKLELNFKTDFAFSVGNSFQHFLKNEDQDGLLSSVNRHLFQNGILIFNTRFPSAEEYYYSQKQKNSGIHILIVKRNIK
ncbi:class I SAM-dependent methyltransferase [Viridibacillus sp. NPDC093762]|uniref:class I SAM-dependent methyltransferase n=1 Tax=Viridibacillus sp. NPDC093762 TaxID=3390720 RepID=UPI003D085B7D